MSEALQNSTGSIGTVSNISGHGAEIETFLKIAPAPLAIIAADPVIEDPVAFAMEKHLEAFLIANWEQTELANSFSIFEEDGEKVGQQYETDAGPIDILAVSKDKERLLVVELKRGRATDVVVGQVLRYMGFVMSEIAEPHEGRRGDHRARRRQEATLGTHSCAKYLILPLRDQIQADEGMTGESIKRTYRYQKIRTWHLAAQRPFLKKGRINSGLRRRIHIQHAVPRDRRKHGSLDTFRQSTVNNDRR